MHRRLLCTIAIGAFAVGTGITTESAIATPVPAVDRSLHLQGAENARDVGGYHTRDGRKVRTGLVYRSDSLAELTPTDLALLSRHKVTIVEDLRTGYERVLQPDRVPLGAVDRWNDVLGRAPITLVSPQAAYDAFITAPGANEAFGNVLRDIIHADGAVLYHCSEGKDRTGWTTAVLLTILGVDRATVDREFLLSNVYLHVAGHDPVRGVTLGELDRAFTTAEKHYGTFDNYIHNGLGLTSADIAALKNKLLENTSA